LRLANAVPVREQQEGSLLRLPVLRLLLSAAESFLKTGSPISRLKLTNFSHDIASLR
jgi:hypothetical protein